MRKNTVKQLVVTAALVVVAIASRSASAACNPPKFAATYNPATGTSVYWRSDITDPTALYVGRVWSNGVDYTGTCNDGTQFFVGTGVYPGTLGVSLSLGNACVPPGLCPSGNLNLRVWITSGDGRQGATYAHQVPETPTGGVNFDFSDLEVQMLSSPRPRVQSQGRVGNTVNLITLPEPIPGDAGSLSTVTGCNIRSVASPGWPGIFATYYPTIVATVPFSGGSCAAANFAVDCSTLVDQWLVDQIVTDAGPDQFVGPATRVNCNPALADPKRRIVPKKTAVEVRN